VVQDKKRFTTPGYARRCWVSADEAGNDGEHGGAGYVTLQYSGVPNKATVIARSSRSYLPLASSICCQFMLYPTKAL